jgi:putative lipoic acid-binding regulatory protein
MLILILYFVGTLTERLALKPSNKGYYTTIFMLVIPIIAERHVYNY